MGTAPMFVPQRTFSRRVFLQLLLTQAGWLVSLNDNQARAERAQQQFLPSSGYGAGPYGHGEYPGYKIYLSLVSREGK